MYIIYIYLLRAGVMEGQAEGGLPQPQRLRGVHGLLLLGHRSGHSRHDAAGPAHLQGQYACAYAYVMLLGQRIFKVSMHAVSYTHLTLPTNLRV